MVTSKHGLSRLLSGRNRLSRLEKEKILDSVLAETAPRRRSRWWFAALPAVAAAVTIVVVLALPAQRQGEFTARGGGHALGAFEPTCAGGCMAGKKLLFDLAGTEGYRYFAAFSQRADGTVLWYFPSSDSATSIDLAQQAGSGVLEQGIVIDSEHPAGTYRVFGVFSAEPLSRQQIRERFDDATVTAGPGTTVIERELVVR